MLAAAACTTDTHLSPQNSIPTTGLPLAASTNLEMKIIAADVLFKGRQNSVLKKRRIDGYQGKGRGEAKFKRTRVKR